MSSSFMCRRLSMPGLAVFSLKFPSLLHFDSMARGGKADPATAGSCSNGPLAVWKERKKYLWAAMAKLFTTFRTARREQRTAQRQEPDRRGRKNQARTQCSEPARAIWIRSANTMRARGRKSRSEIVRNQAAGIP